MPSIALATVAGILFASVALWWTAIQRWRAGQTLLPMASRAAAPWGLADLAVAIGIWLFFNLAALAVGRSILGISSDADLNKLEPSTQKVLLLIGGTATLAACLLIVVALWIRHRVTWPELGWVSKHFAGDVVLGLKAFAMLAPIVYALQWMLTQIIYVLKWMLTEIVDSKHPLIEFVTEIIDSKHPLIELLKKNPEPGFFATAAFAAVIVAPVVEEFLFRVLLQGWLERLFAFKREPTEAFVFGGRNLGPNVTEISAEPTNLNDSLVTARDTASQPRWAAIIVSSFFFALSHWSHGPDPIPLFVFALGLGYLYQRTNRIAPCIVLHLLLNLCSLVALWLFVTA